MLADRRRRMLAEGRRACIGKYIQKIRTNSARQSQIEECCQLLKGCSFVSGQEVDEHKHYNKRQCQTFVADIMDRIDQLLRGSESQFLSFIVKKAGLVGVMQRIRQRIDHDLDEQFEEPASIIVQNVDRFKIMQGTMLCLYCSFTIEAELFLELDKIEALPQLASIVYSLKSCNNQNERLVSQCLVGLSNLLIHQTLAPLTYEQLQQVNFQHIVGQILKEKHRYGNILLLKNKMYIDELITNYLRYESLCNHQQSSISFHKIVHSYITDSLNQNQHKKQTTKCQFFDQQERAVLLEMGTYLLLSKHQAEEIIASAKRDVCFYFLECTRFLANQHFLGMEIFQEKDLQRMCLYAIRADGFSEEIKIQTLLQSFTTLIANSVDPVRMMEKTIAGIEAAGIKNLLIENYRSKQTKPIALLKFVLLAETYGCSIFND